MRKTSTAGVRLNAYESGTTRCEKFVRLTIGSIIYLLLLFNTIGLKKKRVSYASLRSDKMSRYFFCHKKVTRPERHPKRANNLLSQGGGKFEVDTTVVDTSRHEQDLIFMTDQSPPFLLRMISFSYEQRQYFVGLLTSPAFFTLKYTNLVPPGSQRLPKYPSGANVPLSKLLFHQYSTLLYHQRWLATIPVE